MSKRLRDLKFTNEVLRNKLIMYHKEKESMKKIVDDLDISINDCIKEMKSFELELMELQAAEDYRNDVQAEESLKR